MNNGVRKKHKKASTEKSPAAELAIKYGIPVLITFGIAAVMLVLSAIIAANVPDPEKLYAPLSYAALYVPTFVGGVIAAKRSDAPFIASLVHGTAVLLICSLLSAFNYTNADIKLGIIPSVVLHLLIPTVSVAGGFAYSKAAEKKRTKRRH